MWITRREISRLERELSEARQRATSAESRLEGERARVDKLTVAVMDYGATKSGSIAISSRTEPPPKIEPHPKGYLHEPDETELAKLEWYKSCCREAGRSEEEAVAFWEAEMKGEHPPLLGEAMDSEAEQ